MDPLIARFDASKDGDLMVCQQRGVAYQRDMSKGRIEYGQAYWDRYSGCAGTSIAQALNAGRVALVDRHAGPDATVVDIGIGSGEFIRSRPGPTLGTDVNPLARDWLKREGKWCDDLSAHGAFTLWDVIEHVEAPDRLFRHIPDGSHLFCCLPVFDDLTRIRASRHYKPGEHLYYWTDRGFIEWMAEYRFAGIEASNFETEAGRDSILSFAFRRTLPGYHDTVAQYAAMHARTYGASATGLWLDLIAPIVTRLNPASIIDYGCGRSDLVAHFWADGRRRLARYDPAIPAFKDMPCGPFDLALCCDVMEHIRMEDLARVLREIRALSARVIFTIALRPARAKLPDGRNAHVTLMSADEWARWIGSVFGAVNAVKTGQHHLLMLTTF